MKTVNRNNTPQLDRWAFLWLASATVLAVFSFGLWRIPLAAWLAPVFLMRFLRVRKVGSGYLWLLLALTIANTIAWGGIFEIPLFAQPLLGAVFATLYSIPYLIDRLLARRLPGFAATLVFPLTATTFDFLFTFTNPLGGFGLWANAQHNSPVLAQLLSLTGIWGLWFLMGWAASIANWLWEQAFSWPKVWKGLTVYAAILALVLVYGSIRLSFFQPQPGTVRVHQIIEAEDWPNDRMESELPPLQVTDPESFQRITTGMHQKYIEDTIQEARAGAQIVVWPEVAGFADEQGTAALVARGKEVAKQEGIYLVMPLYTVYPDPKQRVDNRLIIVDPAGEVVLDHKKYGCATLNVNKVELSTFDTPYGRMSGVLCCDLDFPTIIKQAGRKGVDILFVPSKDALPIIVQMHAQQAPFRVIENGFSLVRPTMGGISLYTDPYGRVLAMTNQRLASSKVLVVQVPTHRVNTVYSIVGDLFGWLIVAGFIVIAGWAIVRGRKTSVKAASSPESQAAST